MQQKFRYLLYACAAIFIVDALGAIASRRFDFNYINIWPLSLLVYGLLGYIIGNTESLKAAVWLTTLLGIFDATLGWKATMVLNANTGYINNHPHAAEWAITIVFVAIYGALVGLISGGLAILISKQKQSKLQ